MIQRVQSIYLFLASFFYFTYWFFGCSWYEQGFVFLKDKLFSSSDLINVLLQVTALIPLIISIISLIAIFFFKNRSMQIKLTSLSFYLSLFMLIYSMFYFSIVLFDLINLLDSTLLEILLYAAILNPFICCFLLYAARKKMKQDEDLINSINRLR
ncbi:MAG: hypothetical protein CMD23_05080 [Flavobacteriales bacterium]|nr:hypothetical protein [Flavobacteriales bacterium]|tara:strand:+ start:665 stop:1129 length:465 start_codon:yes stop_codon:yes gene_type:complete